MKTLRARTIEIALMVTLLLIPSAPSAGETKASIDSLAKGNNAFAADLYSQLKDTEGNLFFSPYSISTALAMTYGGARAETARQMAQVLHFELAPKDLASAFNQLETHLKSVQKDHPVQLYVANSLWPREGYPFLPDYLAMIRKQYGAPVTPLDYVKETEQARVTINRWVEETTREKIKGLIGQGDLNKLTVLVLVNAIYFKGDWMAQFDKGKTEETPFIVPGGKQVKVPMMYQKGDFRYGESKDVQVLELPYGEKAFSMFIILPHKVNGLKEVEESLSHERLQEWTSHLRGEEVKVYLPRFTVTWGTFNLVPHLKKLGMHDPFILEKADFSGMTTAESICISLVLHKAFVDVNEEGTEAAAATAVVMRKKNGGDQYTFRADHPFLFLIRDNGTGSILFMGRIVNPMAS